METGDKKKKSPGAAWLILIILSVTLLFSSLLIPLKFIHPNENQDIKNIAKGEMIKKARPDVIKRPNGKGVSTTKSGEPLKDKASSIAITKLEHSTYEISNGSLSDKLIEIKNVETLEKNKYLLKASTTKALTFPYGNGEYLITISDIGIMSDRYTTRKLSSHRVAISDTIETETLTSPSFYCDYRNDEELLSKISEELGLSGDGTTTNQEILDKILAYMLTYTIDESVMADRIQFSTANIAETYETKSGVCLDIATLELALLRYNNIESRMAIGYYDDELHHAWVEVKEGNDWLICDSTLRIKAVASLASKYSALEYN